MSANNTNEKMFTKKIALTGLFIAINILFLQVIKIEMRAVDTTIYLGVVSLALSAIVLGPALSVTCAAMSDLIGFYAVPSAYPFFPGYTLSYALAALIFALFLHGNKYSLKNAVIAFCTEALIVEIGLSTVWLHMLNGTPLWVLYNERIVKAVFFTPIYILVTHLLQTRLVKIIPQTNGKADGV